MMRALLSMFLVVVLGLVIAVAPGSAVPSSLASTANLREPREQLQRLLVKLTRSKRQLREVKRREHRVLGELEHIDRSRESAEHRLRQVAAELVHSRTAVQATATRLAATERRLAGHRERLRGRLRTIYKYGRTGYVDILLGAGDIGEFITRWHFITSIVRSDGRLISAYAADFEEARALHMALVAEQQRLATISARTEARQRDMVAQEQAKRAMLARLQKERVAYERMVQELEEDSRQLEVLILRVQSSGGGPTVAIARSLAGFIWPARGVFTSGFGMRRHPIFRIRRMHTGQDIAAPYGTPVQAAAEGQVIYTGWFGGYGKIIVIDHGQGISTLYAHLSSILTRDGARIRRAQTIGRIGSTGYSTGPHVHFEVRVNGRPINPARR
ncbi:MAG TPA: peptidoglycan DD-metalloendopeptidase family protein [bacterium]|nr:peptidoglycan DD-metalloendopeptidase family protein [bacterium]